MHSLCQNEFFQPCTLWKRKYKPESGCFPKTRFIFVLKYIFHKGLHSGNTCLLVLSPLKKRAIRSSSRQNPEILSLVQDITLRHLDTILYKCCVLAGLLVTFIMYSLFEPRHEKTYLCHMRPTKARIRAV